MKRLAAHHAVFPFTFQIGVSHQTQGYLPSNSFRLSRGYNRAPRGAVSFCRLRTLERSPACDAAKIRRLSRRTCSSAWPQSAVSQSRPSSSGPFTRSASNLSLGSGVLTILSSQAHQTRVSALSSRAAALSGQLCGNRWRRSQHPVPFPAAFRPPAFASRVFLRPLEDSASLTVGLPAASRRTPSGLSRSACDRYGRGGCPLNPGGQWCAPGQPSSPGRHPPPSNGRPLFSRLLQPTGESANDEASSRIHSRSPVRPSPACNPRMEQESLGISPGFAPRSHPRRTPGRGRSTRTGPGITPLTSINPPSTNTAIYMRLRIALPGSARRRAPACGS